MNRPYIWQHDPWKRWVETTADEHEVSNEEAEAMCSAVEGAEKVRALGSVPVSRDAFDLPWAKAYEPPPDPTGAQRWGDE